MVARHVAEKLTQGVWLGFLQLLVLSVIYIPGLISSTSDLLLRLPFSRRYEYLICEPFFKTDKYVVS